MSRHKLPTHCYKLPKLPKVAKLSQKMQVTISFQLLFICFPIAFHSLSPSTFQSVHDRFLIAFKSLYDRFMIAFQSFSNCFPIAVRLLSNRCPIAFHCFSGPAMLALSRQCRYKESTAVLAVIIQPKQCQHSSTGFFFSSSSSSSSSKQSIASTAVLSVVL